MTYDIKFAKKLNNAIEIICDNDLKELYEQKMISSDAVKEEQIRTLLYKYLSKDYLIEIEHRPTKDRKNPKNEIDLFFVSRKSKKIKIYLEIKRTMHFRFYSSKKPKKYDAYSRTSPSSYNFSKDKNKLKQLKNKNSYCFFLIFYICDKKFMDITKFKKEIYDEIKLYPINDELIFNLVNKTSWTDDINIIPLLYEIVK